MDLFEQLKQETATVHENIMQQTWANRVLASDYTRGEYTDLLHKYYGFYQPIETQLSILPATVFDSSRAKCDFIADDLRFLNGESSEITDICHRLPQMNDVPSALGVCYVLEGATLGGQMIAKHLQRSLALTGRDGLKFLSVYGAHTMQRWATFKVHSREILQTPQEHAVMIKSALDTFSFLSDWMVGL